MFFGLNLFLVLEGELVLVSFKIVFGFNFGLVWFWCLRFDLDFGLGLGLSLLFRGFTLCLVRVCFRFQFLVSGGCRVGF